MLTRCLAWTLVSMVLFSTSGQCSEVAAKVAAGLRAAARAATEGASITQAVCPLMHEQAVARRLPPAFFVRLIWKESRFNPQALSPKGAQGIAQFMPGTAADRGLHDPFDPHIAIVHSASLLADLRDEFGNVGLAAAAYNAGAERVRNWLAGVSKRLPLETEDYVLFITGRPVDDWKRSDTELPPELKVEDASIEESCRKRKPVVVRTVAETPSRSTTRRQPWGVQLAADFSKAAALARFRRVKTRHASVLGGVEPYVSSQRNLSRGRRTLFAVQVGADSASAANAMCSKIRASGGACVVRKN